MNAGVSRVFPSGVCMCSAMLVCYTGKVASSNGGPWALNEFADVAVTMLLERELQTSVTLYGKKTGAVYTGLVFCPTSPAVKYFGGKMRVRRKVILAKCTSRIKYYQLNYFVEMCSINKL